MTTEDLALLYTLLFGAGIAISYLIVLIIISRFHAFINDRKWNRVFSRLNINEIERINRRN